MTSPKDEGPPGPVNPTVQNIAVAERRAVLDALLTWPSLSVRGLASYLAAFEQRTPAPTADRIETVLASLVHSHLPALEAAGLIRWDRGSGTVDRAAHPALDDRRFRRLLTTDLEGLDEVLLALSHEYRRIVLTELRNGQGESTRTELARQIVRCRENDGARGTDEVEDVVVSLHHAHLPKLSEMDLLEYDPETGAVRYVGHAALEEVLSIIYGPDERVLDRYDGFLAGLRDSYREVNPDGTHRAGWPHEWRMPRDG